MFGQKKPQTTSKPNGVDNLVKKLNALPPTIDLIVAATLAGYSFVAIHIDNAKFVGLVCILIALIFAVLGIAAITREMKAFKVVQESSNPRALRAMKTSQFESYLIALFSLDGYQIRSSIDELERHDDADLIAVRKKETVLVQFNHWDEDVVGQKPIQSLHKAASAFRATGSIAITFGRFSGEATDWAQRKDVTLMTMQDILQMASRLTGIAVEEIAAESDSELVVEQQHEIAEVTHGHHRYLFIDFAGLDHGLARLSDLLEAHPAYLVVASSLPPLKTLNEVRVGLADWGNRVVGHLEPSSDGRFYAIQKFLQTTAEGKSATWLAVDSDPRNFPDGCTEMIAVNPSFGFDSSAAQRLLEAMLLADRKPLLQPV